MTKPDLTNETNGASTAAASSGFLWDLSEQSHRKWLVGLALAGLVIRLVFFLEHAANPSFGVPTLDQKYYDTVAKMLAAGEDLRELHGFRPLLYPAFLALFYKLGGAWGVDLAIFVQHLLGIVTGLIVAELGRRVSGNRLAGFLGGALYLLAPVPLYFEGELLIEASYVFLICAGLWCHLRAAEVEGGKAVAWWLLCGAMTALAAQARANILVFLAVYPLFAAWQWWRTRKGMALFPVAGLPGALAMMVAWGFINMKQSDTFHLMPNAGGVNLYLGNKRGADGMLVGQDVVESLSALSQQGEATAQGDGPRELSGVHYQDLVEVWARVEYEAAMRAQGREPDPNPMAISKYWTDRTKAEIAADPSGWAKLLARKCWLMIWNVEVPNNKDFAFLQMEFLILKVLPVRWVVLLMFAPAGIWAAMRFGNRDALFILLVYAAFYSAGNVAFFVCDRYRYPVWPAMAAFAGCGLVAGWNFFKQQKQRELAWLGGSALLLAVLSLGNWFNAKVPNFAQDYFFRSAAWFEKGRFEEALADVNQSIELDPLNSGVLHHKGNVLFALSRLNEARAAYEAALKIVPGDSGVWNNLGATLEAMSRPQEALEAFTKATQGRLPSHNAFLGVAFMQIRLGRLDDAAVTLDRLAKSERSPSAAMLSARSILARKRGNNTEADDLAKRANALDAGVMEWATDRAEP